MKSIKSTVFPFSLLLIALLALYACQTEEEKTLDQFYPYRSVTNIELAVPEKTDYFIGIDDVNIPLLITAFNGYSEEVELADGVVYFKADGERISGDHFVANAEGEYAITAHLGKISSDTLKIRVLDPSKFSMHLSVDPGQQDSFIADGKAMLNFEVSIFHNGSSIGLPKDFALYCNGQTINSVQPFKTKRAGVYKFQAKGANLETNSITIEALSPVKSLKLAKDKAEVDFFGYNISEVGFVLQGVDANNQAVELSEDIKLFYGDTEIDRSLRFKTDDLGTHKFIARGYKTESNSIEVLAKSPVKSAQLSYRKLGNTFWADGVSAISFHIEAFGFDDKPIAPTADLKLYQGDKVIDRNISFTTTMPGDFKFRVKGHNSESNEIVVTAAAPANMQVIRMPIIFHEVNTTALSQQRINELVEGLTRVFRNKWNHTGGPKDANASDHFIEFYAAERDPDGNLLEIKGLNRVKSAKQSFEVSESKSLNEVAEDARNYYWKPENYINIWVYPNITGESKGYSWAYYPVVIRSLEGVGFTTNRNLRPYFNYGVFYNADHTQNIPVLAHEIGHMLGLAHVFKGNMGASSACSDEDPDFCRDTPYYDRQNYINVSNADISQRYNRISCQNEYYVSTNVMDYFYTHENSFTIDQRTRTRHVLDHGLWLPTPFNGFNSARKMSGNGYEKTVGYRYVPAIFCGAPPED